MGRLESRLGTVRRVEGGQEARSLQAVKKLLIIQIMDCQTNTNSTNAFMPHLKLLVQIIQQMCVVDTVFNFFFLHCLFITVLSGL